MPMTRDLSILEWIKFTPESCRQPRVVHGTATRFSRCGCSSMLEDGGCIKIGDDGVVHESARWCSGAWNTRWDAQMCARGARKCRIGCSRVQWRMKNAEWDAQRCAEWDAQECMVRKNAKWGAQGCGNGRGSWIMWFMGTGIHGDANGIPV